MHIQKIRQMARERKVNVLGKTKVELIRTLQSLEGNFDCYAKAWDGFCSQEGCLWREDCLKDSAVKSKPEGQPRHREEKTASKTPAAKKPLRKA
jgi:hypothetical protein